MESNQESAALAAMINNGTKEISQAKLTQLQRDHAGHLEQFGIEAPEVLAERSRLMEIEQREANNKRSLDNVMNTIQLSNDVDAKLVEFKDETEQKAFRLALKEFGSEKTMKALERNANDPFQTLARLRGYPDIVTMLSEMSFDRQVFVDNLEKQQ